MPDVVLHYVFGQRVKERLAPEIREALDDPIYTFALYGPDQWFMHRPGAKQNGRGRRMHTTKTGLFLCSVAERARNGKARREMLSYLAGFLCHYALDSAAHPYIIWQTEEVRPGHGAHRDFEHCLDIRQMERDGTAGEAHPVTDHYLPAVSLPQAMAEDLDGVYRKVYGWENSLRTLNTCCARFRLLYRATERRDGFFSRLSGAVRKPTLQSFAYAGLRFGDADVENNAHTEWHSAFDPEFTSTESFADLWEKALDSAVRMITAACGYADGTVTEEQLKESLGNRSYLSGLDVDDPRNLKVASLLPPEE